MSINMCITYAGYNIAQDPWFLTCETSCTPLPVPADYPDPCQGCRFLAGMGIDHRKVTQGLPVPITNA